MLSPAVPPRSVGFSKSGAALKVSTPAAVIANFAASAPPKIENVSVLFGADVSGSVPLRARSSPACGRCSVTTENRRGSEVRLRLAEALVAFYFALAPSTVPFWRQAAGPPPAAVLVVGEPVPRIVA